MSLLQGIENECGRDDSVGPVTMKVMADTENALVELSRGERVTVGVVSVDAGTVAIRHHQQSDESAFTSGDTGDVRTWSGWEIRSVSGFGDGGYEVFSVTRDSTIVGVETVFICNSAQEAADAAVTAAGFDDRQPHPAADAGFDEHDQWYDTEYKRLACWSDVYSEHLAASDPAEEADAFDAGTFDHDGGSVEITDPYVGHTGPVIGLPPGRYVAVRWMRDEPGWGRRCARLGVYRTS